MGLPLPLATCLSWVGPPSNLGGGSARAVLLLVSRAGVDRGSKEGFLFWYLSFCSCILIALTSAPIRARAKHKIPTLEP